VINITDGQFGTDLVDTHGLKLQVGHGSGGVLGKRLIDAQRNLGTRDEISFHQMGAENFVG